MIDFTFSAYQLLIEKFIEGKYLIQTFYEYIFKHSERAIILRHDIDRMPENALEMAKLEAEDGITSTYYFRAIPSVFKLDIIKKISDLGHEIGYHYENLSLVSKKHNIKNKSELLELAIEDFENNLKELRKLAPIKTICMHGSPLSKYDNRDLWKKYDYRDFGIIGEPFFDIDFNEVLYLTDTGRSWNASRGNVRDKVQSKYNYNFKPTFDIIRALAKNKLPDKLMLNIHPQRWHDKFLPWAKELVWQNIKNVGKKAFFDS